jgi:TolB-like protein/Flp pilus assembly protein TadD
MFADIAGYTAMTQRNEAKALDMLEEYRRLVRSTLTGHGGTEVKTIGDALLVEFDSALEATRCAFQIQQLFHERNASVPPEQQMHTRIGIHLGDVVHNRGDAYGDAVNIASRIEPLASPGGICISEQVYDQVRNKAEFPFRGLGKQQLKNVQLPVEVYGVVFPWEPGSPTIPAVRDKTRIAVLPFSNISSDSKDEYFADGLTEELIANLGSVAGLRVIARTSVMRFKGSSKGVGEISSELNVGSILEGSVRKAGTKLRVTTQLIDCATEEHLWAQTYDKEMEDVFAIQTDIAQKTASALRVKLLSSEIQSMDSRATSNVEAYTLYLKGRHHWNRRSESGLTNAITYFEQAIHEDPNYALAYAGLADSYSLLGFYAFRNPSNVYPKARELVLKALELDDNLAEAHASLGEVLMQYYHDWPNAEAALRRSISLKPNYPTAHLWVATYLQARGTLEASIVEEKRALELDPLSLIINTDLAKIYYFLHRFGEAEEQYHKSLELDPTFAIAHKGLAEVYAATGRYPEALVEIQKALEISGDSLFIKDDLGYVYALSGERAKALEIIEQLKAASSTRYVPPYGIAVAYFGLGDDEVGFQWLEKAYQERCFMTFVKVDPIFDRLQNDPRFVSVLRKVGLVD